MQSCILYIIYYIYNNINLYMCQLYKVYAALAN